ncbi:MAG: hypothetical protein ACI8V2_002559 [Candidatus Latescibacterota bacterium]|jgi:hypothetical protein
MISPDALYFFIRYRAGGDRGEVPRRGATQNLGVRETA